MPKQRKGERLKETTNSREYRILHMWKYMMDEGECEFKGGCVCPSHRPYWSIRYYRWCTRTYQKSWKKYRKTQYKVKK